MAVRVVIAVAIHFVLLKHRVFVRQEEALQLVQDGEHGVSRRPSLEFLVVVWIMVRGATSAAQIAVQGAKEGETGAKP